MLSSVCVLMLVVMTRVVTGQSDGDNLSSTTTVESPPDNTTTLSPAEELINAAKAAGYELTLERLDEAGAATDEEVSDMMPPPVAEAFISYRQRDNFDNIRERMIGMVFTGIPQALAPRPRYPPRGPPPPPSNRRRYNNPHSRFNVQYNPQEVPSPQEILKPLPFEPGPTTVKFPPHRAPPSHQHSLPPSRQSPGSGFSPVEDFSNTVGPDFGPVTFSEFGGSGNNFGFQNNFKHEFDFKPQSPVPRPGPSRPPPHSSRPSRPPVPSPPRPAPPRPAPRPASRPPPRPDKLRPGPSRPRPGPSRPGGFSNSNFGNVRGGSCVKYTEDICLDAEDYPHEAILTSLARDPSRADSMVAEVRAQSADDLVDGVSAAEEKQYNYQHYFGNRRAGTENHVHRDFAQDGGFLCPSEVKYARPKRARNSKGSWKYIVNMDKYSQTIRMEKCLKPGGACSYVSHHYRATCNQVYNYHRLLSWEDGRGLHMDIFKVPSCCSCHIQGYAYIFPPLGRHQNSAGSTQVTQAVEPPLDPTNREAASMETGFTPLRRRPGQRRPSLRRPTRTRDTNTELHSRTQLVEETPDQRSRETNTHPYQTRDPSHSEHRPPTSINNKVNYVYHPIIDFFSPFVQER